MTPSLTTNNLEYGCRINPIARTQLFHADTSGSVDVTDVQHILLGQLDHVVQHTRATCRAPTINTILGVVLGGSQFKMGGLDTPWIITGVSHNIVSEPVRRTFQFNKQPRKPSRKTMGRDSAS